MLVGRCEPASTLPTAGTPSLRRAPRTPANCRALLPTPAGRLRGKRKRTLYGGWPDSLTHPQNDRGVPSRVGHSIFGEEQGMHVETEGHRGSTEFVYTVEWFESSSEANLDDIFAERTTVRDYVYEACADIRRPIVVLLDSRPNLGESRFEFSVGAPSMRGASRAHPGYGRVPSPEEDALQPILSLHVALPEVVPAASLSASRSSCF